MKTDHVQSFLAVMAGAGLTMSAMMAPAQDSSNPSVLQPVAINSPAPQLAYGVPQILQMAQANVGNDTIVAYIKNSGSSYGLNADQIIYLKQQGLSNDVITAMLSQPKPGVLASTPATSAPQPVASTTSTGTADATPLYSPSQSDPIPAAQASTQPVPAATAAPTVTYVLTVPSPASYYYAQPYCYPSYYYPSYACYPPVSLSFAWGNGWHGGYYGGYYGGWHGGGYYGGYGRWHH
jgi:hypothetical protein